MRRLLYLAALTMTALAVAAAPALAQVAVEGGGATQGDPIPDFVFEEDGALGEDGPSVVIDGDIQTDCRSFASFFEEGELSADADTDLGQARRVLEQCEEAGLLGSGGSAPPSSPDPATADATADSADDEESATATAEADEESATASASAEAEALPDTGGVSPAPLAVLPALLLVGAGVVALRVVRRN